MTLALKKNFGKQPHTANVEDGLYKVRLMTIGEPKMYPGYKGGPEQEKCRFVFEVTKDFDTERETDYRGEEVSVLVNMAGTGPKSTLYQIVLALTGKNPEELGEFDLYELVGQECKVSIFVKYSEDGNDSYSNIKEFLPLGKKPTPGAVSTPAPTTNRPVANSQIKRPATVAAPAKTDEEDELF